MLGTVKVNGKRVVMVMKNEGDKGEQRNFIFPFLSFFYLPL